MTEQKVNTPSTEAGRRLARYLFDCGVDGYDHIAAIEAEARRGPQDGLDVERLLTACGRVGLELFPLQARAIAAQYEQVGDASESPPPSDTDLALQKAAIVKEQQRRYRERNASESGR